MEEVNVEKGNILQSIGNVHYDRMDLEKALSFYKQALVLHESYADSGYLGAMAAANAQAAQAMHAQPLQNMMANQQFLLGGQQDLAREQLGYGNLALQNYRSQNVFNRGLMDQLLGMLV